MAAKDSTKRCCRCREVYPADLFGSNTGYCRPCYNTWRREWRKNNPEKMRAQFRRREERRPGIQNVYERRSYQKHREKRIAKSRRWNVENKEAFAAREAARRACQRLATPAWASRAEMEALYVEAARLTAETGTLHHVDHIVPLQNKLVQGLHTPANLRVIPAFDNQSKSNRTWPDMP